MCVCVCVERGGGEGAQYVQSEDCSKLSIRLVKQHLTKAYGGVAEKLRTLSGIPLAIIADGHRVRSDVLQ